MEEISTFYRDCTFRLKPDYRQSVIKLFSKIACEIFHIEPFSAGFRQDSVLNPRGHGVPFRLLQAKNALY